MTASGFQLVDYGSDGVQVTNQTGYAAKISVGTIANTAGDGVRILSKDTLVEGLIIEGVEENGINGNGKRAIGALNCRISGSKMADITDFHGPNSRSANNITG